MKITFPAFEYTANNTFEQAEYEFEGSVDSGWQILRNSEPHLVLGRGYELVKTRLCGICSTDIDRRFYPFPLPQITGHEVVAESFDTGKKCVVEINDTPYYRGDTDQDFFCREGLFTHSPGRMVLGIDRLPGGFGPYFLAPKHAIVSFGSLNEYTAVLIEPFAAALQAVYASPPQDNDQVAVLGPRRLGSLVIAALAAFRRATGRKFNITALTRHTRLLNLCMKMGADEAINLTTTGNKKYHHQFDIVYDTTGTESGFEQALHLAKREVHLKSTNGQNVCGLNNLTGFVVDELSLLPLNDEHLEFSWENEKTTNTAFYQAPGVEKIAIEKQTVLHGSVSEAYKALSGPEFSNRLPRFDIAIASSLEEIDDIIRPTKQNENSLVRPRGAVLFNGDPGNNLLLNFIAKGGKLRSSRCGDFHAAINLLQQNIQVVDNMAHYMISHVFPAKELTTAFEYAKKSSALKVIVKHGFE